MFNQGDKIFYPVQGAGIIDIIEEKEFRGERQQYYNISLINNSMKLTMPSKRILDSNIRLISTISTLDNILLNINDYASSVEEFSKFNSKQRMEINNTKMKSGSLEDLVQVIITLSSIKKDHTLNSSENQLLLKAKKLLTDEICLVKNISQNEAASYIDDNIILA